MPLSTIQPNLLRKMTVRAVAETLHLYGPSSRAELARRTGIAAPTINKVVSDLVRQKLAEETSDYENARGRPGRKVCLARKSSRVVSISVERDSTVIGTSTLSGEVNEQLNVVVPHTDDYGSWLRSILQEIVRLRLDDQCTLLGIGISFSGLVTKERQVVINAPDLPILNGKSLSEDLRSATNLTTVAVPISRALCTAERLFGTTRGIQDFVVLNVTSVITVGAFCGGELLTGTCGLAGPLGNRLTRRNGTKRARGTESDSSAGGIDSEFVKAICRIEGRSLTTEQVREAVKLGTPGTRLELNRSRELLADIVECVISIYDPSVLLVHTMLSDFDPGLIGFLEYRVRSRAATLPVQGCQIRPVSVTAEQAAAAGVIEHLIQRLGPRLLRSIE